MFRAYFTHYQCFHAHFTHYQYIFHEKIIKKLHALPMIHAHITHYPCFHAYFTHSHYKYSVNSKINQLFKISYVFTIVTIPAAAIFRHCSPWYKQHTGMCRFMKVHVKINGWIVFPLPDPYSNSYSDNMQKDSTGTNSNCHSDAKLLWKLL